MACPQCQGTEWKSVELVHREGTHSYKAHSSSRSAGAIGGSFGGSVSEARTSGYQQSQLSQMAAPPSAPESLFLLVIKSLGPFLCCLIAGPSLIVKGFNDLSGYEILFGCIFSGVAALIFYGWKAAKDQNRTYKNRFNNWRQTKVCVRCGCFY